MLLICFTLNNCAHNKKFVLSEFPIAKKSPHITKIHGYELLDNYLWLHKKENPAVIDYLNQENTYANSWFHDAKSLENKINNEILNYINEDFEEVPSLFGSYYYGSRSKKGLQYPILYRIPSQANVKQPKEEIYLDLNIMAKGHKFYSLGAHEISPNDNLLAFTSDTNGFRQYKLFVKDLTTAKIIGPIAEKVGSIAWANDNKTIFYTVEDHAKRQYRVYRHLLDQNNKEDAIVYEEKDERFNVYISESLDRSTLLVNSSSHTTSEYRFLPTDNPLSPLKLVFKRKQNIEYYVTVHGNDFLIRINDKGNNFRIIRTSKLNPSLNDAKEVIAHRKNISIDQLDVFADYFVLSERAEGLERLSVVSFETGKDYIVKFPEPTYSISPSSNLIFDAHLFKYQYSSFSTPQGTYELDLKSGKSTLIKERTPPGPYERTRYQSERIFATASDGTKVPISLVYRKDLYKKSDNPLHVYGYGSYGYAMSAGFSASKIPMLDRGFVMAIAHIRGGSEFGKPWHDRGKMQNKMNTFTDFITVVEHLVNNNYGAKDKVFIEGGSAGGLLMGAVSNMRPDLFRGVISHVPFVDVINTMLDDDLPLTVGEYEEWGNPNEKPAFDRIMKYSPYDNLKNQNYPSMFVRTALNDSQVMYWEPAKYVAKLRTLKTDSNPLLFLINMDAGHGGSSGRYDSIRERAQDLVYMFKTLDIKN